MLLRYLYETGRTDYSNQTVWTEQAIPTTGCPSAGAMIAVLTATKAFGVLFQHVESQAGGAAPMSELVEVGSWIKE